VTEFTGLDAFNAGQRMPDERRAAEKEQDAREDRAHRLYQHIRRLDELIQGDDQFDAKQKAVAAFLCDGLERWLERAAG
jgi:hypothetical protein